MEPAGYDTKVGIAFAIAGGLGGLNALFDARREAGYGKGERLHEFAILGRWIADSCGNVGKIVGSYIPKDRFPDVPDILTRTELRAFLEERESGSVAYTIGDSGLPPADLVCHECRKRWTIADCHDAVNRHHTEVVPLDAYVGSTLEVVQASFSQIRDSVWRMQDDILIRNDHFIDLTPRTDYPTLKVNELGWVAKRDGITESYVIQPGDEGRFNVWRFYHRVCNRTKLERDMRERFTEVFGKAGFTALELKAVPNQYCRCEVCAPWFEIVTPWGTITLGWRKRVVNIDWSGLHRNLGDLFKDEDVTQGPTFIHAWGYEKVEEYLRRMRQALSASSN